MIMMIIVVTIIAIVIVIIVIMMIIIIILLTIMISGGVDHAPREEVKYWHQRTYFEGVRSGRHRSGGISPME